MNGVGRDFALDPQDLARLPVSRANAGDVEGIVALYEPDAALACGAGRIAVGTDAIRKFYADLLADLGEHVISIHSRRANGEHDGQLRTGVLPKNRHSDELGITTMKFLDYVPIMLAIIPLT